jgi:DNA-binding transcriptional ArsR family regulator
MPITASDPLSMTLLALADPTRRAILGRLTDGEASVSELAAPFEISLQAVSRHLKVLETAGLILRGRDAQWRPCRLQVAPLRDLDGWLGRYRVFWEGSFDKMGTYLDQLQKGDANGRKN